MRGIRREGETVEKEEYQPTEMDKQWLCNLIAIMKDMGIWGTSFAVYRVDKKNKVLKLTEAEIPFVPSEPNNEVDKARVAAVAQAIGWKVE